MFTKNPISKNGGALLAANNLQDLASAATARGLLDVYAKEDIHRIAASFGNQGTLMFDGASSPRAWAALGTAGAMSGQARTIIGHIYVPTTAQISGKSWSIWALGDSSGTSPAASGNGIVLTFNTTGSPLFVRQYGPTASDVKRWNSDSNPITAYGGNVVSCALVVNVAAAPTIYLNGVAFAGTLQTDVGTPNDWGTHSCAYFQIGGTGGSASAYGYLPPPTIINAALTAAEILEHAKTGKLPAWCDAGAGNAANKFTGNDYSFATIGTWTESGGGTITADAANSELDVSQPTTHDHCYITPIGNWMLPGRRYRFTTTIRNWVGTGSLRFQVGGSNQVIGDVTADGTYSYEFTSTGVGTTILFYRINTAALTYSIYQPQLYAIGPIAKWEVQPAATCYDAGTNKIPLVLTAGVTPITTKRDWIIQGKTTTNGNEQLLGASAFLAPNDYTRQMIDSIETNGTSTATVSIGSASGGAQYKASGALVSGRNRHTLVTPIPASANIWVASNAADTLQHTIHGHLCD